MKIVLSSHSTYQIELGEVLKTLRERSLISHLSKVIGIFLEVEHTVVNILVN